MPYLDGMELNQPETPGLERSCTQDWVRIAPDPADSGLQRIEARFGGPAYEPHRHDTYAFGLTLSGVQSFHYRGQMRHSLVGNSIVLHPDELHDGQAGVEEGFQYRMFYVDPSTIHDALDDRSRSLPFLPDCISDDPRLTAALRPAVADMDRTIAPLEWSGIIADLADILSTLDPSTPNRRRSPPDTAAVRTAKQALQDSLDDDPTNPVDLNDLEEITGQSRFALARHFRAVSGTSPHRWLVQRKLQRALGAILSGVSLAEAAAEAGFSDQAHLTRHFKAAYGMTPGVWRDRVHSS